MKTKKAPSKKFLLKEEKIFAVLKIMLEKKYITFKEEVLRCFVVRRIFLTKNGFNLIQKSSKKTNVTQNTLDVWMQQFIKEYNF